MPRAPVAHRSPEKSAPRWHQKISGRYAVKAPAAPAFRKAAPLVKREPVPEVQSPAQAAPRAPQIESVPDAAKASDKQNHASSAKPTNANISAESAPAPIQSIFHIPRPKDTPSRKPGNPNSDPCE